MASCHPMHRVALPGDRQRRDRVEPHRDGTAVGVDRRQLAAHMANAARDLAGQGLESDVGTLTALVDEHVDQGAGRPLQLGLHRFDLGRHIANVVPPARYLVFTHASPIVGFGDRLEVSPTSRGRRPTTRAIPRPPRSSARGVPAVAPASRPTTRWSSSWPASSGW